MPTTSYDDAMALLSDPRTSASRLGTTAETPDDAIAARVAADESRKKQKQAEVDYVVSNSAAGVPLDVVSGLPAGIRAKLSFERNMDKQAQWLAKQPNILGVRRSTDGGLIARMNDGNGKPKDVLVDERGLTGGDLADMTGAAIPAAATAATAYFTGGLGLIPQSVLAAGAGAIAGGAQDVAARKYGSETPVDMPEILANRGLEGTVNAALPLIPGGSKRLAQFVIGKSKFAGPLEDAAAQSAARLSAKSGANLQLTAGQASGNPLLARAESFVSKLPGSNPLTKQAADQEKAIGLVQEYILGSKPEAVPTESAIAENAGKILSAERKTALGGVTAAENTAQDEAQKNIQALLDAKMVPGNITPSQAGSVLRQGVIKARDDFKTQASKLYDDVYIKAGGNEIEVPTAPIKKYVDDLKDKIPDAFKQLAPEISKIIGVGDKIPETLTLRQARELRTLVGDFLGNPDALPGVPERYLSGLNNSAKDSIESAVKNAPNKDAAAALDTANQFYKDNAWKFTQPGVGDLFKATSDPSFIGDSHAIRRVFSGAGDVDALRRYRDLLGPASAEYRSILKSGMNDIAERAKFGGDYIKADDFLSGLKSMSPEFRNEVVGPIGKELAGNSELLRIAQGAKLSTDDLERVLNSNPGSAADAVKAMIDKQKNYDSWYGRSLMKELTSKEFDPSKFNPDEFVSRLVNSSGSSELRPILAHIRLTSPAVAEDIRRRTALSVLERSQADLLPDQMASGVEKLGNFSMDKLAKELRGPNRDKMQMVLGKETLDNLTDLLTVEAARQKSKTAAGAAGQLVTSNILASLMDFSPSEIPRIVKNRIMAGILVTPGLKKLATGVVNIPNTPNARLAVMSSPPILRAIVNEFKNEPDTLGQIFDAFRKSKESNQRQNSIQTHQQALDLIQGNTPDEPP